MPRLIACFLFAALVLYGQANTGTILGTVTDPTGAAVATAKVTAVSEATGFARGATTGGDGAFLIPLVPIGDRYKITVEVVGFKQFAQTGIGVLLNQNVRVDAQLELGQVSDIVEVVGSVPLVDTHSSVRGEVIETMRITELPLNGRNPLQLASLITGVTAISTRTTLDAGNRSGNYVSVNGSRLNETDYQLNGVRFAGSYTNSGLNYPNPDALQEFKLITNPNSAEFGNWSGAVFTAVTRSGTNELHGTLFEFLRNDKLNARNFFASRVPTLRQNQFGASAGGRIIRNRAFWFASYQGLRIRNEILASSFPLTGAERQGLITSATPVVDPATSQPFSRDAAGRYVIPTNRFNPVSQTLLERFVPPAPADGLLITTGSRAVDVGQLTGKIDFNISNRDQLSVSGLYDKTRPNNPFFVGPYPAYGQVKEEQLVHVLSLSETHTFTPNIINEFRFGLSGQEELRTPQNQVTPEELNIANWNYNYLQNVPFQAPTVSVAGRFGIGNSGGRWREGGQNFQFTDMLSLQKGRHSMKAGVDLYHREHHLDANIADTGLFTFAGNVSGNPTADFLLGRMTSLLRIRYLNHPGYKAWTKGFFFQDDWKLHPRFTLNFGVRYELLYPFEEYRAENEQQIGWNIHGGLPVSGGATYVSPNLQSTVLPQTPPGLLFPGDKTPDFPNGIPRGLAKLDKKQIQPRIGFAWDPFGNGRTSIRASFGLFSNANFVDLPAQVSQNLPFLVLQSSFMPSGDLSNPYAGLLVYPPITSQNFLSDPNFFRPFLPAAGYGWSPDYQMPRIMNMTFNVQRQFGRNLMLEVGYAGKLSRHLSITRDLNTATYIPGASSIGNTDSRRRLAPGVFQKINMQESAGNANFHSFQTSLRYQFANGLTFLSSYTWSHSIDNWSTIGVQCACFQDPHNTSLDRASSDFDRRHVYRLSAIYQLPLFGNSNSGVLRAIGGGWEIAGILNALSGPPINILTGNDASLTAGGADRPNLIGDPYFESGRSRGDKVAQYLSRSAFAVNQPGQFGSLGRNAVTGPGAFTTDLALYKNFAFTESMRLQFRTEFFNAFNQTQLGVPVTTAISPAFMRITSAGDPRLIQFGLKFQF